MEQKTSGLGEAEYLLKQAGGAQDLLSQAFSALGAGWVYIAVTLGLPLIVGFGTKSFALGATIFVLSAVLCGPAAYGAFRFYSKARPIAQKALELSQHDAQPGSQQDAAR
ncbi:hypothetical protein SUTH_01515 [Sulfuritalea hydrogenivorans sk43H]|uniref:Uncharacterized protein n=1 Tax=Sulfuritalea hydrogenivorans sk43H TaxID=1223802 RepID=W0SDP0_9PROT|nr:hypothetical protein SUTH_01515 [Sulfuritalea hydrogenivorans sk43H]